MFRRRWETGLQNRPGWLISGSWDDPAGMKPDGAGNDLRQHNYVAIAVRRRDYVSTHPHKETLEKPMRGPACHEAIKGMGCR